MSTLAYAALTARRENADPVTSSVQSSTGLKSYVDVLAALVPAEVLAAHAFILTFTTSTDKNSVTTITQPGTLQWVFFALLALSIVLYVVGHYKSWHVLDCFRMLIPPLAFVGWTMLEKTTAFDAVAPSMNPATRTALAVIGAIVLGAIATLLAFQANPKPANGAKVPVNLKSANGATAPAKGEVLDNVKVLDGAEVLEVTKVLNDVKVLDDVETLDEVTIPEKKE